MFIKKDLRKIPKILADAAFDVDSGDTETHGSNNPSSAGPTENERASKRSKRDVLTELKLARRKSEFRGTLRILCQPKNAPALHHLKSLSVYDCNIRTVDGIGFLGSDCGGKCVAPNLETLNLGRNPIETLPDELSRLAPSLKELWCDDCRIGGPIPAAVMELENLRLLQLANNGITSIPSSIGKLKKIETICLDRNEIDTVPPELGTLERLRSLMLR